PDHRRLHAPLLPPPPARRIPRRRPPPHQTPLPHRRRPHRQPPLLGPVRPHRRWIAPGEYGRAVAERGPVVGGGVDRRWGDRATGGREGAWTASATQPHGPRGWPLTLTLSPP